MKVKILIVILASVVIGSNALGQLPGSPFDGETRVELNIKYGSTEDQNYEWPEVRNLKLLTFDVAYYKSNFKQWGYQSSNRWPALGDYVLPFLVNVAYNRGHPYERGSNSLTGLFLGWHTHALSAIATKHISLSPGIHWGDYVYYFQKYNASGNFEEMKEPSGYYFAAGPALVVDISFFGMILHYEGAWTKAWRMREMPDQEPVEGYPAPNFWNHLVVFQPFGKLHAGFEYAHIVNNGSTLNQGYRMAFYIGYSL